MRISSRSVLIIVVALFFAGFTVMALKSRTRSEQPAAALAQSSMRIMVARQSIGTGAFVQPERDLEWTSFPQESVKPSYIREDQGKLADFSGAVARRSLAPGEPVTDSALIKAGTGGFLSAVLESGKRAVSIAVNPTSGNAGLVFPGDRVDLIVTHRVKKTVASGSEQETRESVYSKTFVQNVRVVAVDQMLDNPENKVVVAKTVTVEVTASQAEKIAVAAELGKISVSLRSLATQADAVEEHAIASSEADFTDASSTGVALRVRLLRAGDLQSFEFYQAEQQP